MNIDRRFNGPPRSANGGYSAGLFAAAFTAAATPASTSVESAGEPAAAPAARSDSVEPTARSGDAVVEITLHRPPPLGVRLDLAGSHVTLPDGTVVAQARLVEPFEAIVPPVSWSTATRAAQDYPGHVHHEFPTCFVCGPARDDGMRIFPGALPDGRTAAPYVAGDWAGPEFVWAALDCPGGWTVIEPDRPYVLGRIAAVVSREPEPGERCVVMGAVIASEGRKAFTHSTLYGPTGDTLGYARATWIAL